MIHPVSTFVLLMMVGVGALLLIPGPPGLKLLGVLLMLLMTSWVVHRMKDD